MTNYTVYGRITAIKKNVLHLSTGHKIAVTAADLLDKNGDVYSFIADNVFVKGTTRFFVVSGKYSTQEVFDYVESSFISGVDANSLEVKLRNLDQQADIVIKALENLDTHDRGQVFKAVGIGVSGAVSLTAAATTAYEVYEWCTGGPFNPMNWLVSAGIATGSAAYGALLYEQLSYTDRFRADKVKALKKAQDDYCRVILRAMPAGSASYQSLTPQVNSLIGKLRTMFDTRVWQPYTFWQSELEVNQSYAEA